MQSRPKRPVSVWIAQILLGLYGAIFLFGTLFNLSEYRELYGYPQAMAIDLAIFNGFMAVLFLGALVSIAIRLSYGRWISIATFILSTVIVLYRFFTDPEAVVTTSPIELAVVISPLMLLFVGPMALVTAAFLFSARVKSFFAGVAEETFTEPPPPPTF